MPFFIPDNLSTLRSDLSEVNTGTPAFRECQHHISFSISFLLIYRGLYSPSRFLVDASRWGLFFLIYSDNLCVFICIFRLDTFKVILDVFGLIVTIVLFSVHYQRLPFSVFSTFK